MSADPAVSIIMPTLATADRADSLRRALRSVREQEGVRAEPIVVVNGSAADHRLLVGLRRDPTLRLIELEEAGVRPALMAGRRAVTTPWFGALDDDDLLLPGALAKRVETLAADPALVTVVTNGYKRTRHGQEEAFARPDRIRSDPLDALLEGNWLLPGSWLCRTDSVPAELFAEMPNYLECTYLAIRFTLRGGLAILDTPTVVWNALGGISRSAPYLLGQPAALEQILALELPEPFRRGLEQHLTAAHHTVAEAHRVEGRPRAAWRAHLRSLGRPGGWRYFLATRHLVSATLFPRRPAVASSRADQVT